MNRPTLTRALAWAASTDAANASMRAGGRAAWSDDDYNAAVETFDRLWPVERDVRVPQSPTPAAGKEGA